VAPDGVLEVTGIAIIARRPIDGVTGTVVNPADVAELTFHPDTDSWSIAGPAGGQDHALLVVDAADAAALRLSIPQLDPRVGPPTGLTGPAYLGMLFDGVPNLVVVDPDSAAALRTLGSWVDWMRVEGATRLTSRPPVTADWQRKSAGRFPHRADRDAVDLSDAFLREDGVVAGIAVFTIGDTDRTAPVRLSGHLEPLDGHYHWYGVVDDVEVGAELKAAKKGTLVVSMAGAAPVPATAGDRTGWGTVRISGVGEPPYPI
jgi:hypothetical protein